MQHQRGSKVGLHSRSIVTCYVLKSDKGHFYCGISSNLPQRVKQHNSGKSISTRNKGYWFLKWVISCNSYREARFIEKLIKNTGVRVWYLKNVYYRNPNTLIA